MSANTPNAIWVRAVGLAAPGLADWSSAARGLRGENDLLVAELPPYQPQLLPANERRRITPAIRQAFRAAEDATARAGLDPSALATVFASSEADLGIIDRICTALAEPAGLVSPTDFHNSVHNAASGYWSIAAASRAASTTLCAYDASFAAGLAEAATQTLAEGADTLLVVYDVPGPPLLDAKRHFGCAASCALVLSASPDAALAGLEIRYADGAPDTLADAALEALRLSNPALRALPLLRLLACRESGAIRLEAPGGRVLVVTVSDTGESRA